MTYHQNRTAAYLFSTLVSVVIYTFYVIRQSVLGGVDSSMVTSFWGRLILIIMGVQILLSILLTIFFTVLQAIATRGEDPTLSVSDERDQIIDLKANRIAYSVFGSGFFLAMVTLAVGWSPLTMFHLIVFSIFAAGIVGYIAQLNLYRKGF